MLSCRFTFNEALQEQLSRPAITVPVFDRHLMHGETGAQAVVDLPGGLSFTLVTSTNAGLSFKTRHQDFYSVFLYRHFELWCSGVGRLPVLSRPQRRDMCLLGSHCTAVRMLWSNQPVLQSGARALDNGLPQVLDRPVFAELNCCCSLNALILDHFGISLSQCATTWNCLWLSLQRHRSLADGCVPFDSPAK